MSAEGFRGGLAVAMLALAGCSAGDVSAADMSPAPVEVGFPARSAAAEGPESDSGRSRPAVALDVARYPWIADWDGPLPELTALEARFSPPVGFVREPAAAGSFAAWLRGLPVRLDRETVFSYKGRPVMAFAAAVILLDIGDRDVHQCADSAIRMHAEYLWASGHADAAAYHFTSGDRSAWSDWADGERFAVAGSKVSRVPGPRSRNDDHGAFRAYLDHLFRYAGTRSLPTDTVAVPVGERMRAGDIFLEPGGPGHAVMLLDVAAHPDGRRVALIGQGFMPAQDFHVVHGAGGRVLDDVWFLLPGPGESLKVPVWRPFPRASARRFPVP